MTLPQFFIAIVLLCIAAQVAAIARDEAPRERKLLVSFAAFVFAFSIVLGWPGGIWAIAFCGATR